MAWKNGARQLRATLPIRRVVGPGDVASLAVHLMVNTAVTGATYDIDGGEQDVAAGPLRSRPMEYLVTMTTHVPDGTPEQAVDDIRAREAARSRELAAQGHLLRLWRPPLQPGEWRTLGLFAAADDGELEQVLASMPLRVWRTDQVTPLAAAPERPGPGPERAADGPGVPDRLHRRHPGGHTTLGRRRRRSRGGRTGQGACWPGAPRAALAAARPGAHAGPVAGQRPSRDAGHPAVAAAGRLDVRADHAAGPAPERPRGRGEPAMTRKVAIITGGSQGIGAGLVAGYRRQGWAVVANALTIKPTDEQDLLAVEGDVAQQATAERIMSATLGRFGRVDTLVNNAGVFLSKPFTEYTADDYALLTGVNLAGFFWLTQLAIAAMLEAGGGHVVNISATVAEYQNASAPSVLTALTKGGLAAATRSWPSSTPPAASGSTRCRRA